MLVFNEQSLKAELDGLPRWSRVAFAASCAQRLVSAYHAFILKSGRQNEAELDGAIEYIWAHVLAQDAGDLTDQMLAQTMALLPGKDSSDWTPLTAYAEDAVSAVAYCLRCLRSFDAQEATWAARCVHEALDQFVTSRDNVYPSGSRAENHILADRAIQLELERQIRDLADLRAAGKPLSAGVLDNLRQRSTEEQAIVLTEP